MVKENSISNENKNGDISINETTSSTKISKTQKTSQSAKYISNQEFSLKSNEEGNLPLDISSSDIEINNLLEEAFNSNLGNETLTKHLQSKNLIDNQDQFDLEKSKQDDTKEMLLENEDEPTVELNKTKITEQNQNEIVSLDNWDFELKKLGNFFEDSFFTDMHQHFHSAVKNVLDKFNESSNNLSENMSKYFSMRNLNMTQENQAVKMIENEENYKVSLNLTYF